MNPVGMPLAQPVDPGSPSASASGDQECGDRLAAAGARLRTGDIAAAVRVLEIDGDRIIAAGHAAGTVRLIGEIPESARSTRLRLVLGEALRMTGDVVGARRVYAPMLADADRTSRADTGLLWRAAMIDYLAGRFSEALLLCDRAPAPTGRPPGIDDVFLDACRAGALAMAGDSSGARESADRALAAAEQVGDDRALAAAHIATALIEVGTRRDGHLDAALAAAERAGDLVQQARVLVNQADGLLREARYSAALDVALRAVEAAGLGGPPGSLSAALCNAGESLLRLGRFEDAAAHYGRSVRVARTIGTSRVALGLCGLAEIDRQLGRHQQSRTAFEESIELARPTGDTQALVPALVGLTAVLLLGPPGGLDAARHAAEEAERIAPELLVSRALVARGRVALAAGNRVAAERHAADALASARGTRRADHLAEALELVAAVTTVREEAHAALREAGAIWRRTGAALAADRTLVLIGCSPWAGGAERYAGRAAAARLATFGVAIPDGGADAGGGVSGGAATGVRIGVLGGFAVLVDGAPVPLPAWRSKQARSLLKILVSRRGRPVPRPELRDLLWPGDEAGTAHRLSVLLSVLRTVLDPARRWPADHHVRADQTVVSLDLDHVAVDVEHVIRDAAYAATLLRAGETDQAREVLLAVDAAYVGDAFGDEPYEDWADGLREEARAVWLRALRELIAMSDGHGDPGQAAGWSARLLAADPYDEAAHQALVRTQVRAGRHGEARRAFARWTAAMRSIDAPPPDERVLDPVRTSRT